MKIADPGLARDLRAQEPTGDQLPAILLGVSVIVAMKNITFYSEKAVAYQLDALGANILVLPKSASLQDYYSADLQNDVFPEEYVKRLTTSDLQGLDNLSPKLSVPVEAGGRRFILTGILPKNEFQAKAAWQMVSLFSRPAECGVAVTVPGLAAPQGNPGAQARHSDPGHQRGTGGRGTWPRP